MISKSLLVPVLIFYFLDYTREVASSLKVWVLLALFFSWVGDVLLLFESRKPIFFLLGLGAFFIAQIFYIVFFNSIRRKEFIRGNVLLLLVVLIYYGVLINFLAPFLGKLSIPVRVYGVVISFMLMLAMHMIFSSNKKAGWWMIIGAVFFIASDSVLAINKFYSNFDEAGILIMFTYGLAQLFIVEGAIRYINPEKKKLELLKKVTRKLY